MGDWIYNATPTTENSSNMTSTSIDLPKTVSLILISACSLLGNVCTVAIVSSFKQHKLPDVLVIGLACTDLIATFIPVPMSLYSYITLEQFSEGSFACNFYGTVAQFTRYASVLIVTLISVERYFAVNRPFIYRKYATPRKCIAVLFFCWTLAFALALAPVLDRHTTIVSHDGFCLFDFSSNYAICILVYAGVQYCIVLVCFVLVTATLLRVYRRRKQLQVQGQYNQQSDARGRQDVTFTRPKLTSRISDIGIALKKAAPILTERFQLGVEAQFARMLFAVVALFYVSWTTLVILITIAQARGTEGQSLALFWGIRLSVISLALNPLLYGLLARQYRMAYWFVLRWIFSLCCCRCFNPPSDNIFITARTPGGEPQGMKREPAHRRKLRQQYYDSRANKSLSGSVWSKGASLPVLTHTTHISLDLLPEMDEDDFMVQEESGHDHSTYIPSVGELSSTVIIPHQARGTYNPETPDFALRASSEHTQLYESQATERNPGTHNPLAVVGDIQGETAVSELAKAKKQFPPLEAVDPLELNAGKVYDNPVYKEKGVSTHSQLLQASPKTLKVSRSAQRGASDKTPLEHTRSSPPAFNERNTLPTNPDFAKAAVTASLDDLDVVIDSNHIPTSLSDQNLAKRNGIPSQNHLVGGGVATADEPEVSFTPRYQLAVSPSPPPVVPEHPSVPQSSGFGASSVNDGDISQPHPPQILSATEHTGAILPSFRKSLPNTQDVKSSVKELREIYEFLSSTPPTSPRSLSSPKPATKVDDSSRVEVRKSNL